MGLIQTAAIAASVYALLQFLVLPRLYRRLPYANTGDAYRLTLSILAAELGRGASLIAAATLTLIVVSLFLVSALSPYGSQEQLAVAFGGLRALHGHISAIETWWGIGIIAILIVALWTALKRQSRKQVGLAFDKAFDKFKADAEAGRLSELPPTAEMVSILELLNPRRERVLQIIAESEASGGDASQADPNQNSELAQLLNEIEGLNDQLMRIDLMRRLDVGAPLAELAKSEEGSRASSFLLSKGFFNLLSVGSRALAVASLALLIPSLIAVASGGIASASRDASIKVHDLILQDAVQKAEQSWTQAVEAGGSENALSDADDELIDQLADEFERYVEDPVRALSLGASQAALTSAQHATRAQILSEFTASRPSSVSIPGVDAETRTVIDATASSEVGSRRAPSSTREEFRTQLSEQARKSRPELWKAFRAKAASALAAARTPITVQELGSRLLTESLNSFGQMASGASAEARAFHALAERLVQPGDLLDRANQLMKLHHYRFLDGIARNGSVGLADASLVPSSRVPPIDDVTGQQLKAAAARLEQSFLRANSAWADRPPSLTAVASNGADLIKAEATMRVLAQKGLPAQAQRNLAGALVTFEDHFPGALGNETRTPRSTLMASTRGFRNDIDTRPAARTQNFVRARSYAALRGFSKVGGVLIGRDPEGGEGPNIVNLSWQESADGVTIDFTRDDGNVLSFGPFRAEIVQLSLAYAADGRPVAVTMPHAGVGRKLLLHPALVNTALGCRARHLDQFVDAFTTDENGLLRERKDATLRIDQHGLTYSFAWALRAKKKAASLTDLTPEVRDYVDRLTVLAGETLAEASTEEAVAATLSNASAWSDPELSPVTSKTDYFESGLVNLITQCLGTSKQIDAFKACILQDPIVGDGWSAPPPNFFSESGVRELPYRLDRELSFLDLWTTRQATSPFQFMLQVTFDSPRFFADDGLDGATFDEKPFEYPALQAWIDKRVVDGLAHNGALQPQAALADLREFSVLQRVWRLALSGGLGPNFPLISLIELGRIRPLHPQPSVRSPVWNSPELTAAVLREPELEPLVESLGVQADLDATQPEACPTIEP